MPQRIKSVENRRQSCGTGHNSPMKAPARLLLFLWRDRFRGLGRKRGVGTMTEDVVARRILAEFEEMPGLMLTIPQASRLFGIAEDQCRLVMEMLVDLAYLRQTRTGTVALGERVAA
jgi:hypothetical protein